MSDHKPPPNPPTTKNVARFISALPKAGEVFDGKVATGGWHRVNTSEVGRRVGVSYYTEIAIKLEGGESAYATVITAERF